MACRGCSAGDGCDCSVVGDGVATNVTGSGTPVVDPYVVHFDGADWIDSLFDNTGVDCDAMTGALIPVRLGDGSLVKYPLPCTTTLNAPFGGDAFAFTFNASTTPPPGDGGIRFDNTDYTLATVIYVDYQEVNGTTIADWLASLGAAAGTPKGRIRVYSRSDATKWADYTLDSVTDITTYYELGVTFNASSGSTFNTTVGDTFIDFTPASDGSVGPAGGFNSTQTIVSVTGTYTLLLTDAGALLECNNASAFAVTVPPNSSVPFPVGTHIDAFQLGAGQITFAAGAGVTIRSYPGLKLLAQYTGATLIKAATNTWYLIGSLTT